MRRPSITQLLPNSIELGYVAIIACIVVLLGNGKMILERSGFIASTDLIGQQVSTKAATGLLTLDSFRFTANAVTFVVWGATGLIIYSALHALVRAMRLVAYERDLETQYVHPQNFTHRAYWQAIVTDTIFGFMLLALLAIIGVLYVIVAVPTSYIYAQRFILHPTLSNIGDPFISIGIAFVATAVLYFALKLVIRHHRITFVEA
jgi:hypothetical protein